MNSLLLFHSNFKRWLCPEKDSLPEHLWFLLREIYPSINWKRVTFYKSLPWFMSFGPPYLIGITIPDTYSFRRFNIYHNNLDLTKCNGIATIIHEAFHILQFTNSYRGFGPAFLKSGLIQYLSCWIKQGYYKHDLEVPAYKMEDNFISCYNSSASNEIINLKKMLEANKEKLLNQLPDLKYNCGVFPLIGGTFIAFLITIFKPIIELIFVIGFIILSIPVYIIKLFKN